jgi:hypothetical protein
MRKKKRKRKRKKKKKKKEERKTQTRAAPPRGPHIDWHLILLEMQSNDWAFSVVEVWAGPASACRTVLVCRRQRTHQIVRLSRSYCDLHHLELVCVRFSLVLVANSCRFDVLLPYNCELFGKLCAVQMHHRRDENAYAIYHSICHIFAHVLCNYWIFLSFIDGDRSERQFRYTVTDPHSPNRLTGRCATIAIVLISKSR